MTTAVATPRRSPRTLGVVCLGLAAAAAALWGASVATWYDVAAAVDGRPVQDVAFTGAQVAPALGGVALLALAGIAGVVATGGVLRRAVGLVLAIAGAGVVWRAVAGLLADPFAAGADPAAPPPPGVPLDALRAAPVATGVGPWPAVLAGLLLLAVGVAVLVREPRLPRLGSRYAAPGARRPPADPDRAAWAELDEGRDPTDPATGPTTGPGDPPPGTGDGPKSRPG